MAMLAVSTLNIQASKKMTTKKAKAYRSDLELYSKTLNETEGIITKKHVDTEKLQNSIEKLKSQEKKLIAYRDGESFYNYLSFTNEFRIKVRDPQLDPKAEPKRLDLRVLPLYLEQIVKNTYLKEGDLQRPGSRSISKTHIIADVKYAQKFVHLKRKELKQKYNL